MLGLKKAAPKEPSAHSLAVKLGIAKNELTTFDEKIAARRWEKAVAEEANDPLPLTASIANLDRAMQDKDQQLRKIEEIEANLETARSIEAQHAREQEITERKAKAKEIMGILVERDEAGARLQAALEQAAYAYEELIQLSEKAQAAMPNVKLPTQGAVTLGAIRPIVATTMWRELGGHGAIGDPFTFPHVKAPTFNAVNAPKSLTSLADALAMATQSVKEFLNG